MEITVKVKSCTREWSEVMVPLDESGNSRKRQTEENFLAVLDNQYMSGSADMYGIGPITIRLVKPVLPGATFKVTITPVLEGDTC